VSACRFDHPAEQVQILIKKMHDVEAWLTSKKEFMNKGGWLTNRLKESAVYYPHSK
jgi:hypothetical protein